MMRSLDVHSEHSRLASASNKAYFRKYASGRVRSPCRVLPKSDKLSPKNALPSCVTLIVLPAAGAQGAQLTTLSALSLPLPELPKLHVSPLDVLSFLLHNPPVTLAAAFGIAYLVTARSSVLACCSRWYAYSPTFECNQVLTLVCTTLGAPADSCALEVFGAPYCHHPLGSCCC